MKALIVGSNGQLGQALQSAAPAHANIIALPRTTLDISDAQSVLRAAELYRPQVIFNAAAYTAVDKAENDEAQAHAINTTAVTHLAAAAASIDAQLLHVSTDFVFDGKSSHAYAPEDHCNPLSVYGRTKYNGEQAAGTSALIVRTGWVYAPTGHNFVRTMLRLMAEREEVRVVVDQIGTPTYAPDLARALWGFAALQARGLYHYSDAGVASWYDFAAAIKEEALDIGLLNSAARLTPVATADYPTPAKRPAFSVLDKSKSWAALGQISPHWRSNLRHMLKAIKAHG
jgi:dTDP-4-dehydrorhamnose reductase